MCCRGLPNSFIFSARVFKWSHSTFFAVYWYTAKLKIANRAYTLAVIHTNSSKFCRKVSTWTIRCCLALMILKGFSNLNDPRTVQRLSCGPTHAQHPYHLFLLLAVLNWRQPRCIPRNCSLLEEMAQAEIPRGWLVWEQFWTIFSFWTAANTASGIQLSVTQALQAHGQLVEI